MVGVERALVTVIAVVMEVTGTRVIVRGAMVTSKAVYDNVRVGSVWRSLG